MIIHTVCYFLLLFFSWCVHAVPANTVVATINVGVTPAGLAVTPDSRYLYVANNNNYGIANEDCVTVVDLATNLPVTTIHDASFDQPYTVTINAAGTKAYVANSAGSTITIIDIATNTVLGTITGFDGPSGMVITPDGLTAYVNNYGGPIAGSGFGNTVRVVDLTSDTIVGPAITVGQAPAALAITPDGAYVYVANYIDGTPNNGTISIIQTSDNTATVNALSGLSGPFAIEIMHSGEFAYITNFGSNNFFPYGTTVSVVSIDDTAIVDTIELGIQPSGLAITPDDRYAYVSNYDTLYTDTFFSNLVPGQGTVNIIDIATNTVLPPTIAVGQSPDAIAISPNGAFAYVSNYTSNSVDVIALQSFQIVAQGCKIQNRYLTQIDIVNKLTWTVSGTSLPVSYSVYRDANATDLAGVVFATEAFEFFDHNRLPGVTYTYYIVGTNSFGTTSEPVAVTVTQNC